MLNYTFNDDIFPVAAGVNDDFLAFGSFDTSDDCCRTDNEGDFVDDTPTVAGIAGNFVDDLVDGCHALEGLDTCPTMDGLDPV
jgi:hypothetical protein